MDLLQLKYFKVVAEQEHITKSAKLLMVSQPYLSAIVARLEEEMGGQLFDRDGRNVVLNEYGKILLHHANEALQHLEDAKKAGMVLPNLERITNGVPSLPFPWVGISPKNHLCKK